MLIAGDFLSVSWWTVSICNQSKWSILGFDSLFAQIFDIIWICLLLRFVVDIKRICLLLGFGFGNVVMRQPLYVSLLIGIVLPHQLCSSCWLIASPAGRSIKQASKCVHCYRLVSQDSSYFWSIAVLQLTLPLTLHPKITREYIYPLVLASALQKFCFITFQQCLSVLFHFCKNLSLFEVR